MIAFIDYRTSNEEINSLKNLNIDVIKVPCNNNLYPAINGHVDIQLNILNSDTKTIILNKDIDNNFKKILQEKAGPCRQDANLVCLTPYLEKFP